MREIIIVILSITVGVLIAPGSNRLPVAHAGSSFVDAIAKVIEKQTQAQILSLGAIEKQLKAQVSATESLETTLKELRCR